MGCLRRQVWHATPVTIPEMDDVGEGKDAAKNTKRTLESKYSDTSKMNGVIEHRFASRFKIKGI